MNRRPCASFRRARSSTRHATRPLGQGLAVQRLYQTLLCCQGHLRSMRMTPWKKMGCGLTCPSPRHRGSNVEET